MATDKRIFIDESPAWLWRAIKIRLHGAEQGDHLGQHLTLSQELEGAELHKPAPGGMCAGCLPADTVSWPCRWARHLLRQHRGEVGWRPHWGPFIDER